MRPPRISLWPCRGRAAAAAPFVGYPRGGLVAKEGGPGTERMGVRVETVGGGSHPMPNPQTDLDLKPAACSACAFLLAVRSCPLCGRRLCKDCLVTHLCRGKGYFRGKRR